MFSIRSEEITRPIVAHRTNIHHEFSIKGTTHIYALNEHSYFFLENTPLSVKLNYVDLTKSTQPILLHEIHSRYTPNPIKRITKDLLAFAIDGITYVWDINKSRMKFSYPNYLCHGIIHCPQSNEIITCVDYMISKISLLEERGTGYCVWKSIAKSGGIIRDFIFFPDKSYIASTPSDIRIMDEKMNIIFKVEIKSTCCLLPTLTPEYFLAGDMNGQLSLCSINNKNPVSSLFFPDQIVEQLQFLPDQQHVIAGVGDSLFLVKINGLTLECVGLICDKVRSFSMHENGDLEILTKDSDNIQRLTLDCMLKYANAVRGNLIAIPAMGTRDIGDLMASYLFFQPPRKLDVETGTKIKSRPCS
ncbi:MAG: hypothetical protein ACYCQI_15060 [Gammaproteobacteria bacterium]